MYLHQSPTLPWGLRLLPHPTPVSLLCLSGPQHFQSKCDCFLACAPNAPHCIQKDHSNSWLWHSQCAMVCLVSMSPLITPASHSPWVLSCPQTPPAFICRWPLSPPCLGNCCYFMEGSSQASPSSFHSSLKIHWCSNALFYFYDSSPAALTWGSA